MKIIKILFLSSYFLVFPISPALAGNNVTITCSAADTCTTSSPLPIFDEKNIYPGFISSPAPVLTVVNQRSADECNLTFFAGEFSGSSALTAKINLSITSGSTVYYASPLSDLLDGSSHQLGIIAPSSSRRYTWTPSFDQNADNDYQNLTAKFNLDFNFSCSPPAPTLTPTATPTGSAGASGEGTVLGAASAPTCGDKAPAGAPILTSAVAGINSVTLTWLPAPAPVSYYLIACGTSSGKYLYGNPNVGGPGTTSYTITNLSANTSYYFVVRAGNGCAPWPFSGELLATPSGRIFPAGQAPPPGFQPGVLGEVTQPMETITPAAGETFGAISSCQENIIPLIVGLIVSVLSILRYQKRKERMILLLVVASALAVIYFWPWCWIRSII